MIVSQPVRVLHVVKSLGLGGTEKAAQLLTVHLDRSRFTPFVFSSSDGERRDLLRQAGVPVIVGGSLYAVLERLKPDVVHLHRAGWAEPELLLPVKRYGPRAVVETNVFGRLDDTPLGATIDMHLFVSRFCLERLAHQHPRLDLSRFRVLYNPVDTDLYRRLASTRDFSRPVAARLSRPDPGKWSSLAFDTLAVLKRLQPDFSLRVIGATPEFAEFVRLHGLEGNVEMLPPVARDEELAEFFASASLLSHSNDTGESFGMAIAEAMASGLPVVTHPSQGQRDNAQLELVEHGVTGLVAATTEDYAGAMAWLWRNPDQARLMGEAGRDKAAALYRVQDVVRRLEQIYADLLGRD